jgi:hypothetical protein
MWDAPLPERITDELLGRIRSEYLEMPGLCLTLQQAQRMWNLNEETCREAMHRLVATGFLLCSVVEDSDLGPGAVTIFRRRQVAVQLDHSSAA